MMKLNQFAIVPVTPEQERTELVRIQMIHERDLALPTVPFFHQLLINSFPETQTLSSGEEKIAGLMATPTQNALAYLRTHDNVSQQVFYNIYLQLLYFLPERDFDLGDPLAITHKVNLPIFKTATLDNTELLHGWYQLLITHNMNGQTFLDDLTSRGYFQAMVHNAAIKKPVIFNGKTQAVYDTTALIHEVVYVESPQDTDHDGQRDLLKVEVTRPAESNQQPVPTLYTASPYNQGTNDEAGDALTHNVNVPLTEKPVTSNTIGDQAEINRDVPAPREIASLTQTAEERMGNSFDYSLNDYFLARGFAVAYASGIGTKDSDGLRTTGDIEETIAATAVIEWLDGKRTAFTNRTDNIAIKAWWSNHHIAMTGRSYLGTLATAAATTGVEGLKTVISEAAISSWYDYYRENGLVIAPGGFPGEDADVLAEETFSREKQPGDYYRIKSKWQNALNQMTLDQDRETGNYNQFWDARNYRKDVANIKADLLLVHGLNDWNVKPKNVGKLWQAIRNLPITKKVILHQGPHVYINNLRSLDFTDMVNLWLTHELYDVDNHAETLLPNVLIQDNATAETWHAQSDWLAPDNPVMTLHLGADKLTTANQPQPVQQGFSDQLPTKVFRYYAKHWDHWQAALTDDSNAAMAGHRLIFKASKQTEPLVIDGRPTVHVQVAVNQNVGMLSFQLIDYSHFKRLTPSPVTLAGQAMDLGYHLKKESLREFQLTNLSDYQLISKAHINLQNRDGLTTTKTVSPNEFYGFDVALQPTHYNLQPGHQLGLIVYATDMEMTVRGNQPLFYTIDLKATNLQVPYLGH
ncbi:Xaa-Pro dipeptidyl-peptidase [Secundilactobacillus paracollinoides]|nr:Xaa-Pro dipeptidyl-peptidase [Secundilactobacillus paracollinoides]